MYKNIKREDIEMEYVNKIGISGRLAAKKLGITYKTFKNKLNEYNIKLKKRNSKYEILNNKEWLYNEYIINKKSIKDIASIVGCKKGTIQSSLKWAKIPRRIDSVGFLLKYPDGRFGEYSSNWRGGKRNGGENGRYTMILKHNHPHADSSGYVMEHRLVIEEKLGRILTKDEIVHHLDGNGHNNDISNLQLTTRKKHFKDHFDAVKELKRLQYLLKENNIAY